MKRFCMSLCMLVLFNTYVIAEDKAVKKTPCQNSKKSTSQTAKTKPDQKETDSPGLTLPCECALIDFGAYWIGERHPENSSCLSPVPIVIPGEGASYGVCKPLDCENGGCTNAPPLSKPSTVTNLVMTEKLPYDKDIYPVPPNTQYMDPKFVKINLGSRTIYAKVYTVAVNVKKDLPKPPHELRGKYQVLIVGYETEDINGNREVGIIEEFPVLTGSDRRGRSYVDTQRAIVNFGLRKGVVFLAP